MRSFLMACLLLVLAVSAPARADDFFEGLEPGLIGTYRDADHEYQRIDRTIGIDFGDRAPLPQLDADAFQVEWTGVLFVRSDTNYRFAAFGEGEVHVEVDGQPAVTGELQEAGWLHGPDTALEFGFLPIKVMLKKSTPSASLRLFWESDEFPREPLPYHLLFHREGGERAQLVEHGRVLFDAHRCSRCHARSDLPRSPEGPPLIAVASEINPDWIFQKLKHQHAGRAHDKMPSFGFDDEQANAVAAWLWQINAPPQIASIRETQGDQQKVIDEGLTLVKSIGCLACHVLQGAGTSGPYGGGDLTDIGSRRTVNWVYTWLSNPDRMHPHHQMPRYKLTPTERQSMARALTSLTFDPNVAFERPFQENNTQVVEAGEQLMKQTRCFNCHKIPASEIDLRGLPLLDQPVEDWDRSCLAETPDLAKGRPAYPQADRAALRAYVEFLTTAAPPQVETIESDPGDEPRPAPVDTDRNDVLTQYEHGRMVLERRNCLACHERDGLSGIVATAGQLAEKTNELRGLSEALIPPNLTAVGDKLEDAALMQAVGGDQPEPRLPWLKVRMPKFAHTDEERAAVAHYLTVQDRIPAAAPAVTNEPDPHAAQPLEVDAETLLAGRQLVGTGGLGCIACHKVGDYEPRNTALGTRGSDLRQMRGRVREEFFHRWCRSPLRVVPGVEMPSYDLPPKTRPDANPEELLATLWTAISDPRFEAPTNPAQVEQLLSLQPGDAPVIVRDVFQISKENGGGYVPYSFAMGFDNGHSILLDLERGCVRDWTFGDFARQRTEGKSWYWDLAGTPLVSGLKPQSDFVLERDGKFVRLGTLPVQPGTGLDSHWVENEITSEVIVRYHLAVPAEPDWKVFVEEHWLASPPTGVPVAGMLRQVRAAIAWEDREPGERDRLWFAPVETAARLLDAATTIEQEWQQCGELGRGVPLERARPLSVKYSSRPAPHTPSVIPAREFPANTTVVKSAPGFVGERLPHVNTLMPTAILCEEDGSLTLTSLKGELVRLTDSDGDGAIDKRQVLAEGLAAPFGVLRSPLNQVTQIEHPQAAAWLVCHKPELLELTDEVGEGQARGSSALATGWGYTDNYHDWSAGPVTNDKSNPFSIGDVYVATSSDYAQAGRPEELCRWRGKVLRISPLGEVVPIAHELRYPMGIAFDPEGRLFVSDQQGVGNCYNEINHIVEGRRYGVKGLYDPESDQPETRAAVQIPHPLTRSVNGIFIPKNIDSLAPFAGHGIGCEYNGKFLVRFSLQEVDGELQGAMYLFSKSEWDKPDEMFLGPMCGAVAKNGDLYIGSIHDSGWLGGLNTGEIVRLRREGEFPNGIRELRATPTGFEIEFLRPVDRAMAEQVSKYTLSGATRVWQGSYATPDSGQYQPKVEGAALSADGHTVTLTVDRLEPSYVYEVNVRGLESGDEAMFPTTGYYTMNRVPTK
ncbi:MAG: c-type cytochrome [Planctomycetaceae bacterium]